MAKFQPIEDTAEDTQTALAVRSHERDEDQLALDKIVEPLVKAWKDAGEPTPDKHNKSMTHRLRVAKGDRTDVTRMVRRAMNLHGADPAWYQPTKPDANGAVVIKFGPQKRKVTKKADTPAAPAAPAPTPTPPAEGEKQRGGVFAGRR